MPYSILTTPKPLGMDERPQDVESQKVFKSELASYLTDQLVRQVPSITYEEASTHIHKNLGEEIDNFEPEGLEYNYYDLDSKLTLMQDELVIEGIHFPPNDTRLGFSYVELLARLPSLRFLNCHFYNESLSLGNASTRCRFETCTFHLPWHVEEGSGPGQDHALFTNCRFEKGITIQGNESEHSPLDSALAFFQDCVIQEGLTLKKMTTDIPVFTNTLAHKPEIGRVYSEDCEFNARFILANSETIAEIQLISTVFTNKFALIHCPVGELAIKNVNFEGLADFYESSFESCLIRKSIFRDFAGFESCRFGSPGEKSGRILLRYVTFYSFTNFRSAEFLLPLDLRNTNRSEQPNFLDCTFSKNASEGTDRETFRIIKHSFEAVGNRIEANVFYALEMEAYRRELRVGACQHGRHWRFWERMLVSLNFLLSRHGQSYWQPLLGAVICAAVVALQQANLRNDWLVWPEALEPLVVMLNAWASGLIVFRPLYAAFPGQEAFILLMTVQLSTCIWHFLVAARRHYRR